MRQIPGVRGVVSALYDVPVGEAWPREKLERLAETVDAAGLRLASSRASRCTRTSSSGARRATG